MQSIKSVPVELTVVLGRSQMPIHQLLRMGRGAVIELDTKDGNEVEILANDTPVARGEVVVHDDIIRIKVKSKIKRTELEI